MFGKTSCFRNVLYIGGVSISTERIDTELEESVFVEVGPSFLKIKHKFIKYILNNCYKVDNVN